MDKIPSNTVKTAKELMLMLMRMAPESYSRSPFSTFNLYFQPLKHSRKRSRSRRKRKRKRERKRRRKSKRQRNKEEGGEAGLEEADEQEAKRQRRGVEEARCRSGACLWTDWLEQTERRWERKEGQKEKGKEEESQAGMKVEEGWRTGV